MKPTSPAPWANTTQMAENTYMWQVGAGGGKFTQSRGELWCHLC